MDEEGVCYIVAEKDYSFGKKMNWDDAKAAVQFVKSEGYSDWKMPNRTQLLLIYQNVKKQGLGNIADDNYWSGSQSSLSYAWGASMSSGKKYEFSKKSTKKVRLIRSSK